MQSVTESVPVPLWKRLVFGRRPKRTLVRALILACTAFVTFKFILLPVRVTGISMEPTYHDRGVNLINCLSYTRHKPQRGDVVGVETTGRSIMYLKRIVGLPGETFAIHNGVVLINGAPLDEPYVRFRQPWEEPAKIMEADKYFVIGDNRGMPQEQHEHGKAKAEQIVGKVLW